MYENKGVETTKGNGANEGIRTPTGQAHWILNPARLPVPPRSQSSGNKKMVSREGFEPTTYGLRVRCSAVELAARRIV